MHGVHTRAHAKPPTFRKFSSTCSVGEAVVCGREARMGAHPLFGILGCSEAALPRTYLAKLGHENRISVGGRQPARLRVGACMGSALRSRLRYACGGCIHACMHDRKQAPTAASTASCTSAVESGGMRGCVFEQRAHNECPCSWQPPRAYVLGGWACSGAVSPERGGGAGACARMRVCVCAGACVQGLDSWAATAHRWAPGS